VFFFFRFAAPPVVLPSSPPGALPCFPGVCRGMGFLGGGGGGGLFSKSITLYTLYSLSIYIERKIYVYTSYIFVEAEYCAGVNPIDKEYRVYNGMDLG